MTRRTALVGTLVALVCAASGCAAVLALEEGVLDETVGAPDGSTPSATEAGSINAPPVIIPPSCASEQPDEGHGLFVSPSGTDAPNCGAKDLPCATLTFVVQRAKLVASTTIIYVDSAKYAETLTTLPPRVTLQGGWDRVGLVWRRQCVPSRGASVTIVGGAAAVGVRVSDLGGEATLDTMTIAVPTPAGGTAKSSYGIFATGASTSIRLVDVTVVAGSGGNGQPGTTGSGGANGIQCSPAALGAPGLVGGVGQGGAGTFTAQGYVAINGGMGTPGTPGEATTGGTPRCDTCITRCAGFYPNCMPVAPYQCGGAGTPGCGGGGGGGGEGGGGGGSSIAVFTFDAQISFVRGALRSGDGGAGGAGGPGESGGSGTPGTMGQPITCFQGCIGSGGNNTPCQAIGSTSLQGGIAGPTGGTGGTGGAGGGGSGGHSYAVYEGGAGRVLLDNTQTTFGRPGAASGNGAPGKAAAHGP